MLSHSDSLQALAPALAQVQAEVDKVAKTNVNPAFKSKYAGIAEVLDTIKPIMEKHGFSYPQFPGARETPEGLLVTLETLLLHSSGEWILSEAAAPLERVTAQGVGSALTYLRRYSLVSILGLAQEDDDAQEASRPAERRTDGAGGSLRASGGPAMPPPPAARSMRDALNEAAEQAGVSREDILAFTDDPFAWLRLHGYAYATLVAAARSARDAKVEQGALTP